MNVLITQYQSILNCQSLNYSQSRCMLFGCNGGKAGGGGRVAHYFEFSIPSYPISKTGIDIEYSLTTIHAIDSSKLSQLHLGSDELPIGTFFA